MRRYFTPRGLCRGVAARDLIARDEAWPLGREQAFTAVEITEADHQNGLHHHVVLRAALHSAHHERIVPCITPRVSFAGLSPKGPHIMGVVNVTPDSFSDGGKFNSTEAAIAHGTALLEAGAAIIDVGGESTRPGAVPVAPDEERKRVIPVIRALAEKGAKVSVDTRHAATMAEGVAAGAVIVNDITALSGDGALDVTAKSKASVILMHMQGQPGTMQQNPTYAWAPGDVFDFLKSRIAACQARGIGLERISVDPGFGFGKTDAHNAALFDHLALLHGLGCVLTVGASRKSFISRVSDGEPPEARLPGSVAAAVFAADRGAHIIRVHDVAETRQALAVWAHMSGA
ncbi:MAG: dihydropteroate synthase [Rhodospirillaceae bacterium]|nr:dihydropteroate synthase [Rhodospirillaceae bacterium]